MCQYLWRNNAVLCPLQCFDERGVINLEIRVHDNDVEKALKLLKRLIQKEGILGELKKRRYYEKPSVKLRRKQREARKRKAKSSRSRR